MADKFNRQQIYKSRLNDLWEILENNNGYFWRRTAANNEIVGGSHISFKTKAECEANARLVGYEEQYNQPGNATWEFYQDGKNEYRWRLFDGDKKLNVCHEGYKGELSAQKNAVRHGWGGTSTKAKAPSTKTSAKKAAPKAAAAAAVASTSGKTMDDCNCWIWVILLALLGLLFGWWLHNNLTQDLKAVIPTEQAMVAKDSAPAPVAMVDDQIFNDVANDAWYSEFVNKLAKKKLINGYRTLEGEDTGDFGPDDSITIEQLIKMSVNGSDRNVRLCGSLTGEPAGYSWSAPFVKCATNDDWTITSGDVDLTRPATRGEIASMIVDAFDVTTDPTETFGDVSDDNSNARAISMLASDGVVGGYLNNAGEATGNFGPNDNVTRAQTAKIFCNARETYLK
jgi:uncharacterized protein YegP (UPF0339 family)